MVLNSELDSHQDQHNIQIFYLPQRYLVIVFQNVLCSIFTDKETIITLSKMQVDS